MDLWQLIVLAIIQGLTEFLPISSSAHLILLPQFTGWQDQGLAFDVAVHVGTLVAVLAYFRRDLALITCAWLTSLRERRQTPESRLGWGVLVATIPVGLAGLLFSSEVEDYLRSPTVIAIATIVFGILLWWADRRGARTHDEYALRMTGILLIGVAQAISLIPGTGSRSPPDSCSGSRVRPRPASPSCCRFRSSSSPAAGKRSRRRVSARQCHGQR